MEFFLLLFGVTVGIAIGWLAARSRSAADIARLDAMVNAAKEGETRLEQSLQSLSHQAVEQSHRAITQALAPLQDTLTRYDRHVHDVERDRIGAYESLSQQVRSMAEASQDLRTETSHLVAALRTPHVRGRWGEHQLHRIVEAAGMLDHCDFDKQVTGTTDKGTIRPDLVVRLHGGRQVVVDAKVPCDAYLSAMEAQDENRRVKYLIRHAKQLRAHVENLGGKCYWEAFEPTPEFVVLFVPADPFLDAALQHDPTLLEYAFAHNVVLAAPSTLIALLRTVAYAWRQESLAHNALAVHALGRELYTRLSTMGDHLAKVGSCLASAVTAYNKTIGSLEARVLVSARKLADLGVSSTEIETPAQVETVPRQLQAPELVDSEYAALIERSRDHGEESPHEQC